MLGYVQLLPNFICYSSSLNIDFIISFRLLEALSQLCQEMSQSLSHYFYPDVAEEFICSVIKPRLDEVANIVHTAQGQLTLKAGTKHDRSLTPVDMESSN